MYFFQSRQGKRNVGRGGGNKERERKEEKQEEREGGRKEEWNERSQAGSQAYSQAYLFQLLSLASGLKESSPGELCALKEML